MNVTTIRGQLRERPSQCEVGDWITARSRPEWDRLPGIANYSSEASGVKGAAFRLEPYINGKRISVWVRVR